MVRVLHQRSSGIQGLVSIVMVIPMPKDSLSRDEFRKLMEGFAEIEHRIVDDRLRTNYRRHGYEFLTEDEAALLDAMLNRLIPQDPRTEKIDLVSFMDWAIPRPLGYGSRREGLPDESSMFREGLKGTDETASAMFSGKKFIELSDVEKDQVLQRIQEGNAEGCVWQSIPSDQFFQSLMRKAVAGYCAHPWTWMRIGFYGPAYPEGYVWITEVETRRRHEKGPGYFTL